ncbi:MAG: ribosome biogenesis protein ytm1 [Trizodia sp. TS-e1964]|nr:MAG: ribosome biogenesis protein ytm1 [Trizodia sp. TS-e1964]
MADEAPSAGLAPDSQLASQIKVQFTTRHPDIALPDNSAPILVPTNLRRYGLSTIVNHFLPAEKPIPLDFLINGAFLRSSIDAYLTEHGLSSETTLTLEYVRALVPPTHLTSFQHDNWVSSVDVLSQSSAISHDEELPRQGSERILSSSYDGLLRVWNTSAQVLATSISTSGGHAGPLKTAKFFSPAQIVSSGFDRTIRLWALSQDPDGLAANLTPQLELYGHRASVDALAVHARSTRVLSASADHSVGVWSLDASAPAAPTSLLPATSAKRRKTSAPSAPLRQAGPVALLKGHTAPVSSVIFAPNDATVAYSASQDHTVRTWDLPTRTLVDTRTTSHALLSLTSLPSLTLLAAGTSARHISLLDPRVSAQTTSALTLRGHGNAVVALDRDPVNEYGLLSGSHDGTCRLWDVRAGGEAVFVIQREGVQGKRVGGEGVKVFDVRWDREVGIVSAGEDRRVQINRGEGVGRGGN